ncbi:MAG TPA: PxKF domain-containing protein [Pyrinomonadaceae bacterium]
MFGLLAVGLYSAASASSARRVARGVAPAAAAARAENAAPARARRAVPPAPALKSSASGFMLLRQLPDESIATYAYDDASSSCTGTPKNSFALGEKVCATVTGGEGRRVYWVARTGSVVQADDVTSDPQTFVIELPRSETTEVVDAGGGAVTVDNRGVWKAYIVSADASVRRWIAFTVHATTPFVDLQVAQSATSQAAQVSAGSSSVFDIFVTNNGPEAAQDVVLTDVIPANASFVSLVEDTGSGFQCTPPGTSPAATCTLASLPAGGTAKFSFAYEVNAGASADTVITNVVSVASSTAELDAGDNTSALSARVPGSSGTETCTLTCHENVVATADSTQDGQRGAFVTFGSAGQAGNCGAITATPSSNSFFPVGTTVVNVSSGAGGGSCSFTVTVVDSPAPTISCPADVTVTVDSGVTSATVSTGAPTTTPADNVSVVGVRSDTLPQTQADIDAGLPPVPVPLADPYPVGTTLITWTVTEASGRTASCTQRITVRATERAALTISCPADVNAQAPDGACQATVSTGAPTTNLTDSHVSVAGVRSDGRPLADPYPAGQTSITWTATDDTDDSVASCVQTVNVTASHDSPPTLHVPDDVTVETSSCSAILDDELGVATAEGNCGAGAVSITRTGVPLRFIFPVGTTVITYTARDAAGHVVTGTQRVTVHESTPPTITAPADVEAFADASCVATVALGTPAASDNCRGVRVTNNAPAAFPLGQTVVTWTATDASGNTATDTQVVTVVDNTPPALNVPAGGVTAYLPLNSTATSMPVTFAVTASDNCAGVTLGVSPASGSVFGVGPTTVTATATDGSGNKTTKQFTVTVLYNFAGFFSPISGNPLAFNEVKAGQAVPVKFSLSGYKGTGIFAPDSPTSVAINCDNGSPVSPLNETVLASNSGLNYDAASDRYIYVWKTQSAWKDTCRQLVVTLNDGSTHTALFKFK